MFIFSFFNFIKFLCSIDIIFYFLYHRYIKRNDKRHLHLTLTDTEITNWKARIKQWVQLLVKALPLMMFC